MSATQETTSEGLSGVDKAQSPGLAARGLTALGKAARWVKGLPNLARDNISAEREARELVQSVWGVCLASRPRLLGPRQASSDSPARARAFGSPVEWAAAELGRASPKALRIAFRASGLWSVAGKQAESSDGSESWGEWVTTPLILAGMMNDAELMELFLAHSDEAALRRRVPLGRAWRMDKLGSSEEGSDVTPLLAAALFSGAGGLGALMALGDRMKPIAPSERAECLRRAPSEAIEALRAYFDRLELDAVSAPAPKSSVSGGRL